MDKTPSVTRKRREITVAPSPFNPVKFELGLIMLLAVALFFMVEKWVESPVARWGLIAAIGLSSMLWLIVRTIYISRKALKNLHQNEPIEEVENGPKTQ